MAIGLKTNNLYDIYINTDGAVNDLVNNIASIDDETVDPYIQCSIEQINKAYKASYTLKKHEDIYDSLKKGKGTSEFVEGKGYPSDTLGKSIILALQNNSFTNDKMKEMLLDINDDIKVAFRYGKLTKKNSKEITTSKLLYFDYLVIVYNFFGFILSLGLSVLLFTTDYKKLKSKILEMLKKGKSAFDKLQREILIVITLFIFVIVIAIISILHIEKVEVIDTSLLNGSKDIYTYIDSLYEKNTKKDFDFRLMKDKINTSNDILKNTTIIGDSYSNFMLVYIDNIFDIQNESFSEGGKTIVQNMYKYLMGINKTTNPIFVCSMGYNDHIQQTDIKSFKEALDILCEKLYEKNIVLVLHSFIKTDDHKQYTAKGKVFKYDFDHYDYVMKKNASYYGNVIYVDCHDLATSFYDYGDHIHYGFDFYRILVKRILDRLSKDLRIS